ncbi:MAG: glycosyltransferase, partial [Halobacteriota archaeon]
GRYCESVIVNSTQTKQELIQQLRFHKRKIQIISLGVDERFEPKARDDRDYLVIGFIGNHAPRKRIDYLIKAFYHFKKEYPTIDAKLKIYGHCNRGCGTLHALPRALRINNDVEFHGAVPEDMLVHVYNSFDVFVMPSDWEGFGLPILEAQRCGVPVIIRADAHIPEEVGRQCIKATTEQHMATLFHEILTKDFRDSVVQSGLRYSRLFTWERTTDETFNLYESILETHDS